MQILPGSKESAFASLFGLKLIPIGSESQAPSTTDSESTSTARSSPSSGRRRSVSTMKDLIPLKLSPSSSSVWSDSQPTPADEGMADRVADCLPEVLARDLELSAAIFAEKKMTAGAPVIPLSAEERARLRASRLALYSPYLAASARVHPLDPIEERDSTASFVDQEVELPVERHDLDSESSSTTSHCSSDGAEPPEFRHRGSVVTTATSLASVACRRKNSLLPDNQVEHSWIEADSDGEDHVDSTTQEYNVGSLSPRPPTPPCSELGSPITERGTKFDIPNPWIHTQSSLHRKSHSVSGGSPSVPVQRQLSGRTPSLPVRPSTMNGPRRQSTEDSFKNDQLQTTCPTQCQSLKTIRRTQSLRTSATDSFFPTRRLQMPLLQPAIRPETSLVTNACSVSDDEGLSPVANYDSVKPHALFVRPPTPPEPLRSVQSWLNSSLQPYPWVSHNDEAARAVPLPPDAIETLRVSVACFPETMLLTSSLTVETIRSYAKKMRHPVTEALSISGDTSIQPPRKSLWRKVFDYNKGPQLSDWETRPRYSNSRQGSSMGSSSSEELDMPKPWTPIRNVFGHCSDYICDAIYAHIVSYNYVSALVARNPVPVAGNGRTSSISTRDQQQQDDIPKKAASLLGLTASASAERAASRGRFPRRVSSPLGEWNKEGIMTSRNTTPSSQDNALRVIQSGLLQCIARLVATAKLMADSDAGEERMVDMEAEDADMLFMRSLCEIVRMAEEAS
ncbi:hypothetical protein J3459_013935 [Metarhizium acridum]|nr:hypothetical protein J3459_013935 [Metarhizium acridum]